VSASGAGRFDPALLAGEDEPVRRFFAHALAPGAPVGDGVRLTMRGRIRAGRWLPFTARQEVGRRGFAWRARVGLGPLTLLRVVDAYAEGGAATELRLLGRFRVARATGADTIRSAAGRAALEAVAFAPGSVLPGDGATWRAESDEVIRATLEMPPERVEVRVVIDDRGAPREISASRWGPAGRGRFEYLPCVCRVLEERRFGPFRVPGRLTVAWTRGGRPEPFFEVAVESLSDRRAARARAERTADGRPPWGVAGPPRGGADAPACARTDDGLDGGSAPSDPEEGRP
jgi:hypothetical protein